jgi:hypothetical protein
MLIPLKKSHPSQEKHQGAYLNMILPKKVCTANNWWGVACDSLGVASNAQKFATSRG